MCICKISRAIVVTFVALFALSITVRAQSERTAPAKQELRDRYTQADHERYLESLRKGEIPPQGGPVASHATDDVRVNNNNGAQADRSFTQSEPSIIAWGNNVVIGFNDAGSYTGSNNQFTGWSYSTDGGVTFTDGGTLPVSSIGDVGDPVLARNDVTGRIYFSTLGFNSPGTIQMWRSDDNGVTWMAPVNATPGGSNEDKQWHTVDNFPGPGNGNVYVISRRFGTPAGIYVFRSTDHGETFGPSGGVNIVSGNQGAFIAVGPDHSVYAFWWQSSGIMVRKSTDRGVTFGAATTVATFVTPGGTNGDLGLTGRRNGLTTFSSFRSQRFPHVAINPVSGNIYVTYNDRPAVGGTDKADIYFVQSTDGGATWSTPFRVNDDATTTDQWQPTIAATGSQVGIFYYSRQDDPVENNLFRLYGRIGHISGATITWQPSFAISNVPSLPEFGRDAVVNSTYMGDYIHAVATPAAFHVAWADNREDHPLPAGAPRKDPNVYYERIPTTENFGWVRGVVTSTVGGAPVQGVQIDFVENIVQVGAFTDTLGRYFAGVRVDTPGTTVNVTLRARKFAYLDTLISITITRFDTLVRNFAMTPLDLVLTKSSITFAATPVPGSRRDSLVARNQRTTSLTLSSLTTTNPDFSVTPTSATIPANDSVKIYVTYTPTQEGSDTGRVIILSNSTYTPRADVILSGTAIGVPRFTASTDSVTRTMEGGTRDSVQFYVRNVGTTSGNFSARAIMYPRTAAGVSGEPVIIPMVVSGGGNMLIDEQAEIARSMQQQPVYEAPKGVPDIPQGGGTPRPLRRGGPDAFGNIFIDSDEPDGPRFDWVDIRGVGTQITTWTGSADDGYATIPLPFSFPFYGGTWTGTLNVCTNGFISRNATSTAFTNVCLPATAVPNDVIYAFWDDLDLRAAGTVHYYHDAAANQFIVQYTNVPRYPGTAGDSLTFQVILRPNGLIVVQYLGMVSATLNSATIGIENATGTVALQVSCNETGYMHNNLAIAFLPPGVTLQPPWLAVAPTSGTLAIGDSIQMTARFNATDSSIYNNPGNYLGRIEVAATNSALAETLRVHARMFVIPPPNARLSVNPDSLNFGNVEIGTSRVDSVLVRNIGGASLTVTGITMSNTNFSASPTSFTLPSLGEQRVRVTFTAPSPGGTHAGTMTFVSNDPQAPQVRLRAVSVGVAHIAVTPDTFHLTLPASGDTTLRTFTIRNPGTDTLRYTIDETGSGSDAPGTVARSMQQQEAYELPKGAVDDRAGGERSPAGRGGPDAFGYIWIDSDEPDGPRFSWVNIRGVGTQITGIGDDTNVGPFPIGFDFSFYGNTYNQIRFCTNGFLSFTSTATTYTNTAIPTTAEPNNALYAFWDDLNFATAGGTAWYYYDAANQRFIVQYDSVARFGAPTERMTFQIILKPSGDILYQYLRMTGTLNSATIGIENASGTIALQVVYNQAYMHDSLAVLLTRDLFSWMSVDPTSGTIAPGDSQTVRLRIHPAGLPPGTRTGRQRITGNTPDVRYVGVRLDVITGVESGFAAVPTTYGLEQNYPNPFNPTTTITYALPSESRVQLRVYNMLGQEVATLVDGTQRAAYYTVQWDGRSRSGTAVSSGIYFVRIDAVPTNGGNTFRHVKKMLLVK